MPESKGFAKAFLLLASEVSVLQDFYFLGPRNFYFLGPRDFYFLGLLTLMFHVYQKLKYLLETQCIILSRKRRKRLWYRCIPISFLNTSSVASYCCGFLFDHHLMLFLQKRLPSKKIFKTFAFDSKFFGKDITDTSS